MGLRRAPVHEGERAYACLRAHSRPPISCARAAWLKTTSRMRWSPPMAAGRTVLAERLIEHFSARRVIYLPPDRSLGGWCLSKSDPDTPTKVGSFGSSSTEIGPYRRSCAEVKFGSSSNHPKDTSHLGLSANLATDPRWPLRELSAIHRCGYRTDRARGIPRRLWAGWREMW